MINNSQDILQGSKQAGNDAQAHSNSQILLVVPTLPFHHHPSQCNHSNQQRGKNQRAKLLGEHPCQPSDQATTLYTIIPVAADSSNNKHHEIVEQKHKEQPHKGIESEETILHACILTCLLFLIDGSRQHTHHIHPESRNDKGKNQVNKRGKEDGRLLRYEASGNPHQRYPRLYLLSQAPQHNQIYQQGYSHTDGQPRVPRNQSKHCEDGQQGQAQDHHHIDHDPSEESDENNIKDTDNQRSNHSDSHHIPILLYIDIMIVESRAVMIVGDGISSNPDKGNCQDKEHDQASHIIAPSMRDRFILDVGGDLVEMGFILGVVNNLIPSHVYNPIQYALNCIKSICVR